MSRPEAVCWIFNTKISAEIPSRRVSQRRVEQAGGDEFGAMLLALGEDGGGT